MKMGAFASLGFVALVRTRTFRAAPSVADDDQSRARATCASPIVE